MEEKQEGLVLRSIDFKDREKIITLFTPHKGLISIIIKGISRKKQNLVALASPFTHGEYHFKVGRTDLYLFLDGSVMNHHHNLRHTLEMVEAATGIAKGILSTQFQGKAAPALYALTLAYLKHLPNFENPGVLHASFLLKLLKHEGQLSISKKCSHCTNDSSHIFYGESLCSTHLPAPGIFFSQDEWNALFTLTQSRNREELKGLLISQELKQKIETIFQYRQ